MIKTTTCRYCIAFCGIQVEIEGDRVVDVRGNPDHPLSQGFICSKGRRAGVAYHDPTRFDHPWVGRPPDRRSISLGDAMDDLCMRLAAIADRYGPESIGVFCGSGAFLEYGVVPLLHMLFAVLGSPSIYSITTVDNVAKIAVSSQMTGHPVAIPHPDWDRTEFVLIIGSNPVVTHGHDWCVPDPIAKIHAIKRRGGEVWVMDPLYTETAQHASRHLAIRAGTDYAVVAHLARELLIDGADRKYLAERADGIDALREAVEPFTREFTSTVSGLPLDDLDDLLAAIIARPRIAVPTGTGITMSRHPTVTVYLAWALHILTQSFERPGGSWFNPDVHMQWDKQPYPSPLAVPGPGPRSRPDLPSWVGQYPSAALADEIKAGHLRALLVAGGNPAVSIPGTERITRALGDLEVLAVMDVVRNATSDLATHVLPCTSFLEHSTLNMGTAPSVLFGQYSPAILPAVGSRKPQMWYVLEIARRLGVELLPLDSEKDMTEQALRLLGSHGRIPYDELVEAPNGVLLEEPRRAWVEEVVLANRRWQLGCDDILAQLRMLASQGGRSHLIITPRRQPRHVNTMLVGVRSPSGKPAQDEPDFMMNTKDAADLGIADGQHVELQTATGKLAGRMLVSDKVVAGTVSVPHAWENQNVNHLIDPTVADPVSGMVVMSGVQVTVTASSGSD